jgi:hypothetical protein
MQIYLAQDSSIDLIHGFLSFVDIAFEKMVLWNNITQQFDLPRNVTNSILVIDRSIFHEILKVPASINSLISFCNNSNQLWVFGQFDHAISYLPKKVQNQIQLIDQQIKKSSMVLFLESELSNRLYLDHLINIEVMTYLNWHLMAGPRVQAADLKKEQATHNYLLTMIKKPDRPHRDVLWKEMNRRPGLIDQGLVTYKQNPSLDWVGHTTKQHHWVDGHASMDLYLDCYLEIVPESCYRDVYFFTEKTLKPLMTKTPFLTVSNAGYLQYLKNLGFQTFDSLIDESYDQHYRLEDRVKSMTDVLQYIIANGSREFYQASQDILDHNFLQLCEIAGGWQYRFDSILWQALNNFKHRSAVW